VAPRVSLTYCIDSAISLGVGRGNWLALTALLAAVGCSTAEGTAEPADAAPGLRDAGTNAPDGGGGAAPDLAPPVPGALSVAIACNDAEDAIYTTPSGLPALGPSSQGDVV